MADTKISALTASTTPLAGTEVLPIVQSGVTKQVSVANLTAGRAVSASQMTLTAGNLIVTSGAGIDFSATPGTGTSELFSDYEEGTFTPTITGFSTPGTGTYTTQTGLYTKIGNVVNFTINLVQTNHTGTGVMLVNGLPFAIVGTSKVFSASVRSSDLALTALNVCQIVIGGTGGGATNFALEQVPVGGGAAANVAMDTAFSITITGSYMV